MTQTLKDRGLSTSIEKTTWRHLKKVCKAKREASEEAELIRIWSSSLSLQNGEKINVCCLRRNLALVFLSFLKNWMIGRRHRLNSINRLTYTSWSKFTWLPPSEFSGSRKSLICAISDHGQFKNDSHRSYYLDPNVF